jgi:hypothetical protein
MLYEKQVTHYVIINENKTIAAPLKIEFDKFC